MHRKVPGTLLALVMAAGPADTLSAQAVFVDGFEVPCAPDTDGDRLDGCAEQAARTDPLNADTDADGLKDGDEVLGTVSGLDLPSMGVQPRHKDLLVEMDWTDDAFECTAHSHRVTPEMVEEVRIFFAALPVTNPDGVDGIHLVVDFGQGGVFDGGNFIA